MIGSERRKDAVVQAADELSERLWQLIIVLLAVWSLLAVVLAQLGLFRAWTLLAAGAVAAAVGVRFWRLRRPLPWRGVRRETAFVALVLAAGLFLYMRPAEHLPLIGDSAIYPNTAARLIRDHGLVYSYKPLDGLTPAQKELFYVPASEQVSHEPIESYEGLLYGAYYVMDAAHNEIVSSRPPVTIVWMGLFGYLFGLRGMLYVTPLFGTLSLVMVYFLGNRLFGRSAGALAAIWLLLSFPQLHFSRAPYAEVVGQFFVVAMVYALASYLQTRRTSFIVMGLAALAVSFAARLDVILTLPAVLFFLFILIRRRDTNGIIASLLGLVAVLGYTLLTINRPYVGAMQELLLAAQLRGLTRPQVLTALLAGGVLAFGAILVALRRVSVLPRPHLISGGIILVLVLVIGYALHIRPLTPEFMWSRGQYFETYNNEIMAIAAQYVSALLFWLAAGGASLVIWRQRLFSEQGLLVVFVISLASVFFWKYTTGRIYPVALRRLLPEVLPGMMLLGAYALSWLAQHRHGRTAAIALAGLVAVLQIGVSGQYWFHREAPGTWDFIQELSGRLPTDAVAIFEPQVNDSIVGWFAAPLWSIDDRRALLLRQERPEPQALGGALCHWQKEQRAIYLVAQRDPAEWWPAEFQGNATDQLHWNSSLVGQSLLFPPYVWHFDFLFTIYRLTPGVCPA